MRKPPISTIDCRPDNLKRLMEINGLNAAKLARQIDVHRNTVTAWCLGKQRVPAAVIAYLDIRADIRKLGGILCP